MKLMKATRGALAVMFFVCAGYTVGGCDSSGGGGGDDDQPAVTDDGGNLVRDDAGNVVRVDAALVPDGGGVAVDGAVTPGADGAVMAGSPAAAGPFAATTVMATVMRGSRSVPVIAHVPTRPAGQLSPAVLFMPGFMLQTSMYLPLAERIASHGVIVVRVDTSGSDHAAMALDVGAALDWAVAAGGPLAGKLDVAKVALAGHSLGGKLATMAAFANRTRVAALLALDPVNSNSPDVVPDQVTPLTMPVGFMGETVNGSGGFMPCAPTDSNFETFYAAATGASWAAKWDLTGADHMDFVDVCNFLCSVCPDGPADDAAVRGTVKTLAVAFLRRHLLADAAMDAWLSGASLPGGVVVQKRP